MSYLESSTSHTKEFYEECGKGISEERVAKVYKVDLSKLKKRSALGVAAAQKNLMMLGALYDGSTSVLIGNNNVKHGYKVVYVSDLSNQTLKFDNNDYVVLSGKKKITSFPTRKGLTEKDIICTSRLIRLRADEEKSLRKILVNMEIYSNTLREIADVNLKSLTDPYYYLSKSLNLINVSVNDPCPCMTKKRANGQPEKYKRCHGLR
ncbi:MAG: SEC-C domain-containing protein [Patescibacteria group bacterium]